MKFPELCQSQHLRLTKPRQEIFTLLQQSDTPIAISDVIKKCPHINRSSIYRTLDLFNKLNITKPVHVGWKTYYELAEPFAPHHHHLHCIYCKKAIPIQTPELENLIHRISDKHNFIITKHHFELEGVCKNCHKLSK